MARTPWRDQYPAARIAEVEPDSIADELEIQPGDVLLTVNGLPVTDYIAYRFAIADDEVMLEFARGEERLVAEVEKEADEDLGLIFTGDVFDGVRSCANNCVFCFELQMPTGMRGSLQLRDDDFRLSFLHGNFLTLTNLREEDYARIVQEHLSPLYVSVHATDDTVRRGMLRNRRAPDILPLLRRLGEGGIEVHTQIVLCPGWNDGAVLTRTLADLIDLYPTVASVGIVPVGLTGHRPRGPEVRAVTAADARAVLQAVDAAQADALARHATRIVYAADEFYLLTDTPLPPTEAYEDFPQAENGIGLARLFLDEVDALDPLPPLPAVPVTLVTGTLAAPLLDRLAEKLNAAGAQVEVLPVCNHFYGGGVSVAGLLTGRDIRTALDDRGYGNLLLIPDAMVNADGVFLDDESPESLEAALGVPVLPLASVEEMVEILQGL